ncbi:MULTISPECIES: pectinesterase family protein [Actinoplanes]|uniref:pectinesterase family protein n=1 Tax=Actinoplanes TaxID=1865 RepID=UPI000A4D2AF5|nr:MULTISPECIES: pectinesterase family protein [Actinoplanes]GLY02249.1 pectinesterase [Actinoplanes sp. NBRC 101535]
MRSRRIVLSMAALVAAPVAVLGVTAAPSAAAITLTVASDGTATYRTVQAAVNAVPSGNSSRATITIKAGTYRESVVIPADKPWITLEGLGSTAAATVIVNNKPASTAGTTGSATVYVQSKEFYAKNLTFSNDYDEAANGSSQALALALYGDRARLGNVRVIADQDTLLIYNKARAYIWSSYIEGTVDFIYGNGAAVFYACTIHEKRSTGGYITAANTEASSPYGFLIYKSTITGVPADLTYLGRPWGASAQVTYRESNLSSTIRVAQPWTDMSGNSWKNARFYEYKNTGAGATTNSNRRQLTDAEAANYTPQKYLAGSDGWNPAG